MTDTWTCALAVADLFEDSGVPVILHDRMLALFLVDGQAYATDAMCTHGAASLCDGFMEGHEVECPFHQGRFDIRTGAATCAPAFGALTTYAVKVQDGEVFVQLP
ncbi:MAG: non-heme iron oxygenase ferredoxin subunit [Limnohabitans sp.]|nr:non-heme iron oxygenase ferredoxin subunit [Limnohabitans sp.]